MQRVADAMPAILAHEREAGALDVPLYRAGNVEDALARPRRGDAPAQRLASDIEQPLCLRGDDADGNGDRGVTVPAVHHRAEVNTDDVTLLQGALSGMPCTMASFTGGRR